MGAQKQTTELAYQAMGEATATFTAVETAAARLFIVLLQARNAMGAMAVFWEPVNFNLRIGLSDIAAK